MSELKKRPTLYDITQEFRALQDYLDECEGDVTDWPELMVKTLEEIPLALEVKADGVCRLIAQWKAEEDMYKKEMRRLQARARIRENAATRLKKWVESCMVSSDLTKIKTEFFTLTVRSNPHSVPDEHIDFSLLPKEYQLPPQIVYIADKEAIKAHFKKTGEQVPGAQVIQTKSLMIK